MNVDIRYEIKTKYFVYNQETIGNIIKDFFKNISDKVVSTSEFYAEKGVNGRVYEIINFQEDIYSKEGELDKLEDLLKSQFDDIDINYKFSHYEGGV